MALTRRTAQYLNPIPNLNARLFAGTNAWGTGSLLSHPELTAHATHAAAGGVTGRVGPVKSRQPLRNNAALNGLLQSVKQHKTLFGKHSWLPGTPHK